MKLLIAQMTSRPDSPSY